MSSGGGLATVVGTAAGAYFGGPAGAVVGAGVGSAIDQSISGNKAAEAQGEIAKAQLAEQQRTRALATAAATPSVDEINQLTNAVKMNQSEIDRKQKILDSSDPALIEAGKQALGLLKGQESSTLNPIRQQRAQQRAQLESRLRSQLGAGFETSTAGAQALASFDRETDTALAGAQQNTLSSLLGVAQNSSAQNNLQPNISNAGSLASLYGNQNSRMVSAINGTPITASGAQFVTDLQQAKNSQQTAQNLMGLVGAVAPLAAGAGGGGSSAGAAPAASSGSGGYLGNYQLPSYS